MPWAAVASIGAQVIGGAMNNRATRKAADQAAQAQREALAENRRQFDMGMARQLPFHEKGVDAVNELSKFRFQAPTAQDVENDPGYAFGLREGRNALEGSAAAGGGLFSGNALKALTRYGTDYGTTKYNDAFERARSTYSTNANTLGNLVNAGTGAATQMQNAGANFANNNSNLLTSGANMQGAAGIAQANNWGNVLNQGVSTGNRNNWWQKPQQQGAFPTNDSNQAGDLSEWGMADGGPVLRYRDGGAVELVEVEPGRYEPRVGSRSARPGASGGGMSRENVLRAVAAPGAASAPARTGMGALPANPVTNPAEVTRQRLIQAGAYRDGGPVGHFISGALDSAGSLGAVALSPLDALARAAGVDPNGTVGSFIGRTDRTNALREALKDGAFPKMMAAPVRAALESVGVNGDWRELDDTTYDPGRLSYRMGTTAFAPARGQKFKDGGPVMVDDGTGRMVPKVGTRTPLPGAGGTGGGMSRDQILQALSAAQAASAPAQPRTGMGALPANPVTNPEAVTRQRMIQAGAYADGGMVQDYDYGGPVMGPGGPRDDAIPAHLSNGEFVVNARAVNGAGGGSNARGQKKLNALMRLLEGI